MTAYMMQNGSLKSIPLSAVKPETLAQWWSWAGQDTEKPSVTDAYSNVPWLYRGVNAICNAVVSMPHSLHKGNEEGEEVDPNTLDFATHLDDLLDIFTGHLLFYGACYGILDRNEYGIIRDFRPYDPKTITPQYDAEQGFIGVKRTVNGKEYKLTPEKGLFYVWVPNRTGETGPGVSDVQAALAAAGVLRNIDIYADMYFKNGAVNPTLISVENGSTVPSDVERMKLWYKRMLSGVRKAFGIEMISGKITAQTIGYALKDLATTELTASKREDVSTALGIPQTLLFSNAANYATAMQDDLHFYDKNVKPKAIRLQNALNKQVYEPMGYYLKFHPERMEIYQQQEEQKSASVISLYQAGIMTLDEVREHMNLAPLPKQELPPPVPDQSATTDTVQSTPDAVNNDAAPTKATHTHEHAETPVNADLIKWQTVAVKRFKEGKIAKALDFTSDVLRPSLVAAIKGSLEDVTDVSEIKRVFSHALEWAAYP